MSDMLQLVVVLNRQAQIHTAERRSEEVRRKSGGCLLSPTTS